MSRLNKEQLKRVTIPAVIETAANHIDNMDLEQFYGSEIAWKCSEDQELELHDNKDRIVRWIKELAITRAK